MSRCKAALELASDHFGLDECTFHCELTEAHGDEHQASGKGNLEYVGGGHQYTISWQDATIEVEQNTNRLGRGLIRNEKTT